MRTSRFITVFAAVIAGTPAWAAEMPISIGGLRMETQVKSVHELRWSHVHRQELDVSCGSAALSTILRHYFDDEVDENGLISGILYQQQIDEDTVRRRGGFSLLDLKKVATAIGYSVRGYRLSLEQLSELDHPAIVPVTIRKFRHFVVFRKIIGDRVVLADPAFGNVVMARHDFEAIWKDVALVISKDGRGGEWEELPFEQYYATATSKPALVGPQRLYRNIGFNEF